MKESQKKMKVSVTVVTILFCSMSIISTVHAQLFTNTMNVNQNRGTSPVFPSQLEPGDLLFMDVKPWIIRVVGVPYSDNINHHSNDHVVLYIGVINGIHEFIEANNYTIYTGLGNITLLGGSGVQMTPWPMFCLWAENFTIGKVTNATEQQKQAAIAHAYFLMNKHCKYQSVFPNYPPYFEWADPNITDPSNPYYHQTYYYPFDPFVDYYFCAELVWSCYLSVTSPINLDPRPQSDGTYEGHPAWTVGPKNGLLESTNITFITVNEVSYPQNQDTVVVSPNTILNTVGVMKYTLNRGYLN